MSEFKRREFLKLSTLSALPIIASSVPLNAFSVEKPHTSKDSEAVYFINDGIFYRPEDFIQKLQEINALNAIERDSYGEGATLEKLLNKFKEKELIKLNSGFDSVTEIFIFFLCH